MSETLVRLEGVSKRFCSGPFAVAEVTTTILGGGITALAGPDGAGKTTLLRLMLGLLEPDAGKLEVCELDPISQAPLLREVVGYMPQRFGLLTILRSLRTCRSTLICAALPARNGRRASSAYLRLRASLRSRAVLPAPCLGA